MLSTPAIAAALLSMAVTVPPVGDLTTPATSTSLALTLPIPPPCPVHRCNTIEPVLWGP